MLPVRTSPAKGHLLHVIYLVIPGVYNDATMKQDVTTLGYDGASLGDDGGDLLSGP